MEQKAVIDRQIAAYALWLQDRGLAYPQVSAVAAATSEEPGETVSAEAQAASPVAAMRGETAPSAMRAETPPAARAETASAAMRTATAPAATRQAPVSGVATDVAFVTDAPLSEPERDLLTKIIAAMSLDQQRVSIVTAIDSDPRSVRAQLDTELAAQHPTVVILLGQPALRAALGPEASFRQLGGRLLKVDRHPNARFLATHHPRDLIRHPATKRQTWADLQKAMAVVQAQQVSAPH